MMSESTYGNNSQDDTGIGGRNISQNQDEGCSKSHDHVQNGGRKQSCGQNRNEWNEYQNRNEGDAGQNRSEDREQSGGRKHVRTVKDDISLDEDEELEKYLAYIHTVYSVFGFGLWTVELKGTKGTEGAGEIIGRCGLQPVADENSLLGRIELGYLIDRCYRRCGYAFEACRAILDYAFNRLEIEEVYALIDEENVPSRNLAEKLGFRQKEAGMWVVRAEDMEEYMV